MTGIPDPANEKTDGPLDYYVKLPDRKPRHFQNAPTILSHPYLRTTIDETIVLAKTKFWLEETDDNPFNGTVHFSWKPYVRVQAAGQQVATVEALEGLFTESDSIWSSHPELKLPDSFNLTEAIEAARHAEAYNEDSSTEGHQIFGQSIQPLEVGSKEQVTEVRFLVPNAWNSNDGFFTHPSGERYLPTRTRAEIIHDGWRIRLDRLMHVNKRYLDKLKHERGYGITHIGRITKVDDTEFSGNQSLPLLRNLNFAFSLMMGRHVSSALPIGYTNHAPTWAWWQSVRADPAEPIATFRDDTIANTQFMELGTKVLDACTDPVKRDVLRIALGYLIQANRSADPELAVSMYTTGLLLLAHNSLVTERHEMSSTKFRAAPAEDVIETILRRASIDTAIPEYFEYLQRASDTLQARDGQVRDALGCVTKMRNEVMHPTRERMTSWTGQQWIECKMVASYFLETAVLHWLDYNGQHSPRLAKSRWTGATEPVPWRQAQGI